MTQTKKEYSDGWKEEVVRRQYEQIMSHPGFRRLLDELAKE